MKWNENNIKRNLFLHYSSEFFGNLDFSRGIFVLFLLSKDFNGIQIGLLQTILFWSNLLFEVPSGVLADRFKRKYIVGCGLILTGVAGILMLVGNVFWMFVITFILHGAGFALKSGADQAILYDGLKQVSSHWENKYLLYSGRVRAIASIALVIATAVGGYLFKWGWDAVFYSFAICMFIGALLNFIINEPSRSYELSEDSETNESLSFKVIFRNIKSFLADNSGKSLLLFVFGMGLIEAFSTPFFVYFQILFKENELSVFYVGLLVALSLSVTSISYMFNHYFEKVPIKKLINICCFLCFSLLLLLFVSSSIYFLIIMFILIDLIPSMLFVHTDNYIHERVPSNIRSSFVSIQSFVASLLVSFVFISGGFLIESFNTQYVLASFFLFPLIAFLTLKKYFAKEVSRPQEAAPC